LRSIERDRHPIVASIRNGLHQRDFSQKWNGIFCCQPLTATFTKNIILIVRQLCRSEVGHILHNAQHRNVNAFHLEHCRSEEHTEEHTSELQSRENLVCRLLLEKKKRQHKDT